MDPMLAVNRREHGGDLVAEDRGKRCCSREHRGDLQAHLAQRGGHLSSDEPHADHHGARTGLGDLTDRITLRDRAQLIDARQARSGHRQAPVASASAEHQLVVVHRRSTFESQLLEGRIYLPHGGPGAQLNVVVTIPFGGLDVPGTEVFLTPQIRFGQRRTAERNARLRAQEHNAAPPSLFSEGHSRIAAGEPGSDNDHGLLTCCVNVHCKESSRDVLPYLLLLSSADQHVGLLLTSTHNLPPSEANKGSSKIRGITCPPGRVPSAPPARGFAPCTPSL